MPIPFHYFPFFSLFLLLACQAQTENGTDNAKERPPNIVLIFTDDQGYSDVGVFGAENIATPHLDRMAENGKRFTNFYVAQAVCSASRAALLTGCYPNRLGIHGAYSPNVGKGLHPQEQTIAELLKPLGYATAIYGKWHLGSEPELLPTRQGFDEYFGIPYSNDMWPLHPWQGTVFDFPPLPLVENETVIDTLEEQSQITKQYTKRAVQFITDHKDQPFFLYVPHSMPHVPLYASDDFKGKSKGGLYGDVIEEIDWSVGQILATLEAYNLEENTLVIFTSDNGPWLSYGTHSGVAKPLREGKGTSWEGGIRVPCIVQWTGKIPAGVVSDQAAMTIDLLPTIAQLTGAQLPDREIDGRDMSDLLFSKDKVASHHEGYAIYYHRNELQAVLSGDGRWKLVFPHRYRSLNGREGKDDGLPIDYEQNMLDSLALFDLQNDISESQNMANSHPEIVAELQAFADVMRAQLGDELTGVEGDEVRALGQVGM
ncbi:MAG: sulfatase [Bacteroidota bacterium]